MPYDMDVNYEMFLEYAREQIVKSVDIDDSSDRGQLTNNMSRALPEIILNFFGVKDSESWASQIEEDVLGDEGVLAFLRSKGSRFNEVGEIEDADNL